jgi:hypothetical protein
MPTPSVFQATGGLMGFVCAQRADYAMTLLDVAEDARMIGRALGVGGAKPLAKRRLQVR